MKSWEEAGSNTVVFFQDARKFASYTKYTRFLPKTKCPAELPGSLHC